MKYLKVDNVSVLFTALVCVDKDALPLRMMMIKMMMMMMMVMIKMMIMVMIKMMM
jgi:hypothetical protein